MIVRGALRWRPIKHDPAPLRIFVKDPASLITMIAASN
jgi:hypothetical protein